MFQKCIMRTRSLIAIALRTTSLWVTSLGFILRRFPFFSQKNIWQLVYESFLSPWPHYTTIFFKKLSKSSSSRNKLQCTFHHSTLIDIYCVTHIISTDFKTVLEKDRGLILITFFILTLVHCRFFCYFCVMSFDNMTIIVNGIIWHRQN